MTLEEAVQRVPEFKGWGHAERIRFFMWYLHTYQNREHIAPREIGACFDKLHVAGPANIVRSIAALTETRPKQVLKTKDGYRLEHRVRESFDAKYGQRKKLIVLEKEFIPEELLRDQEAVPKLILHEINVCYEFDCFNGCAVLIRRLVESLIILAFDVHGIADQIRDGSGNYLGLEALISRAQKSTALGLTRNAKSGLPGPKFYGDLAAHNPRARVRKGDLDHARQDLRVVIEELGALSSPAKRSELSFAKPTIQLPGRNKT